MWIENYNDRIPQPEVTWEKDVVGITKKESSELIWAILWERFQRLWDNITALFSDKKENEGMATTTSSVSTSADILPAYNVMWSTPEDYNEKRSELALIDKVPWDREAFGNKVIEIANRLGTNPNWIMAVIYKESTFDHTAKNPHGWAYGLLQRYPRYHKALMPKLYKMWPLEQLDEVATYLKPYMSKINSYDDMYLAVFNPASLWKEWAMRDAVAKQNKGVDINKDWKITVEEFRNAYVYKNIPMKDRVKLEPAA